MTETGTQQSSAPSAGPLAGVTILDLTHVVAGPFSTLVLAELGARVIKVKAPGVTEITRQIGPHFSDGESGYHATFNAGKESLTLDLKADADRAVFDQLMAKADVLVENFVPGVMERLGLDWERVHAAHPGLIYASISGFGQTGPLSDRKANDGVIQAMGGIMSLTGPLGGPPTRIGPAMADMTAGLYASAAINGALYHKKCTGQGIRIDIAMLDVQIKLLEHTLARYHASGIDPAPLGSRHPTIAPFDVFETADGWILVTAAADDQWQKLLDIIERPDLKQDPRFEPMMERGRNSAALAEELGPTFKGKSTAEWAAIFDPHNMRVAPVLSISELMEHPQVGARNMVVTIDGVDGGTCPMPGNPIKITGMPDPATRPAPPAHDRDRDRILRDFGIEFDD